MERRHFIQGAGAGMAGLTITPSTATAVSETEDNNWEPPARTPPESPDEVPYVESAEGVVTTSHPLATQAGIEVLKNGGNAVDAAAAVQLALAVVEPNGTGLGGGGFMSVYSADDGKYYGINKNIRAIAGAEPDMSAPWGSGLEAGVPGIVRGLDYALKRWGTRYFDELAQPAIELAEEGWELDLELSRIIHDEHENFNEVARDIYLDEDGNPPEPGYHFVQEDKAWTLKQIAEGGSEAFYQGEVAERVVDYLQGLGANYELDDFARYNVTVDHPIWIEYDGHDVAVFPEDGGISVAQTLELWDRLPAEDLEPGSPEQFHYHMQAVRAGTADYNAYATDPEYVDLPHGGLWDEGYLDDRFESTVDVEEAELVDAGNPWAYQVGEEYRTRGHSEAMPRGPYVDGFDDSALESQSTASTDEPRHPSVPSDVEPDDPTLTDEFDVEDANSVSKPIGTNHYAVADAEGNLVLSMTTLGVPFSTGIVPEGVGFNISVLQSYFGSESSVNEARPHKRPALPGSHVVAFDQGEPVLAIGTPQGPPAIKSALPITVVNTLTHGMDLAEATYQPRIAESGQWVQREETLDDDVVAGLNDRGHATFEVPALGAMQSIRKHRRGRSHNWSWAAAADTRRDGDADGVGDAVSGSGN